MILPIFDKFTRQEQTKWASTLNPTLSNPLMSGLLLKDIPLVSGSNVINHKLGRALQGYIITGMRTAFSQVYSTTSSMPDLTLSLQSSAPCTVDLYVF